MTNIQEEIWKDIVGYEGLYQVSNLGRVKSKYRIRNEKINSDGYNRVTLCNKKVVKAYRVHRLVALSFIPNPDNKPFVNHLDRNRLNNKVSNLEWCTPSENVEHSRKMMVKENINHQYFLPKLNVADVIEIRKLINTNVSTNSIAKKFNVGVRSIRNIKSGATWSFVKNPQ